jgi:hypothetical protein
VVASVPWQSRFKGISFGIVNKSPFVDNGIQEQVVEFEIS